MGERSGKLYGRFNMGGPARQSDASHALHHSAPECNATRKGTRRMVARFASMADPSYLVLLGEGGVVAAMTNSR